MLAVFDQTFPVSHSFLEHSEQTEGRQHLKLLLGHSETLLAELDGVVIGFITVDDVGYIPALYVGRTGIGVGSALLQATQDRHERFGLHVFAENVLALQFYKARGFSVVDEDTQIDSLGRRHHRFEMERANGSIAYR
ncbi:GNAT family N-acetyltransferase [Methylobacterium sp. J-078]|uniref:GNAT family N-acetyltransferase n=1 Tax=Methylobacterium sp. J-078 TaxID=2836657 RepID=UPI001FBB5452|nr:GNAT family N-acetyltransferase [Methylobacterium sp. J-078]MCJ2044466.1 GNAT family N-acetyltransferase [Methylobacterium sp. J-078]